MSCAEGCCVNWTPALGLPWKCAACDYLRGIMTWPRIDVKIDGGCIQTDIVAPDKVPPGVCALMAAEEERSLAKSFNAAYAEALPRRAQKNLQEHEADHCQGMRKPRA